MTKKERARRAAVKKEMQKEGILPPDKPRLNYKKYLEDTKNIWESDDCPEEIYLICAISIMLGTYKPTKETIGVAKVIRIAKEWKQYDLEQKAAGRKSSLVEVLDRIDPIMKA